MTFLVEFPSFPEMIRLALRLDPHIFAEIQATVHGIYLAFGVVVVAALSESLGQSVVLFLNRVQPRRFAVTLAISTLSNIVGYFLWTATVWLVVRYAFALHVPIRTVAIVVGLAYAPQVLAFFELTPFLGNLFSVLLSLWSMVAITVAINAGLGLEIWQAVVSSGLGWLLIQIWRRSLGRPLYGLRMLVERRTAGVPLEITLQNVESLRKFQPNLQNWQEWLNQRRSVIDDHLSNLRQRDTRGQK